MRAGRSGNIHAQVVRTRLGRFVASRASARCQRGAVMVEAALVVPVIVLLVMGIIEFGFAFGSATTATGASRSGSRLAAAAYATSGTIAANQQAAADQIADTVAADLNGLTSADPVGMVIYRADPGSTSGEPVGGFPADDLIGGCTQDCFRYEWDGTTMSYVSGSWPDPDACGLTLDSIGVYVQAKHYYITGMIGDHIYVDGHTVMRLEPLPSDQCAGSST